MRCSIPGLAVCIVLLTSVTATLNGDDYSINHPTTSFITFTNVSIDCDGGCPMGESVIVQICKGSDCYRSKNVAVGPNATTWSTTVSPPDYGWSPAGSDWNCKLLDSGYELEIIRSFTVMDFGA